MLANSVSFNTKIMIFLTHPLFTGIMTRPSQTNKRDNQHRITAPSQPCCVSLQCQENIGILLSIGCHACLCFTTKPEKTKRTLHMPGSKAAGIRSRRTSQCQVPSSPTDASLASQSIMSQNSLVTNSVQTELFQLTTYYRAFQYCTVNTWEYIQVFTDKTICKTPHYNIFNCLSCM